MERYVQLGIFHAIAGALIVLLAILSFYQGGIIGPVPLWYSALKLIFGVLMLGAGIKLLRT